MDCFSFIYSIQWIKERKTFFFKKNNLESDILSSYFDTSVHIIFFSFSQLKKNCDICLVKKKTAFMKASRTAFFKASRTAFVKASKLLLLKQPKDFACFYSQL